MFLHFNNVGKFFGERCLFKGVSFRLGAHKRVGIIGPNGSGKSTLLKMAAGLVEPDSGAISVAPQAMIQYLPQQLEQAECSGGELQQAALFELLHSKANVFLLDEPTNNLDEETVRWFESQLLALDTSCLVVSHDRGFLDRVVDELLELDPIGATANIYGGNFSFYETKKRAEEQRLWRSYEVQQKKIAQLEHDILATKQQALVTERSTQNDYLRGRSKKVAAKAKARETRLRKMADGEHNIEKPRQAESIRIALGRSDLIGRLLIDAQGISCTVNGAVIVEDASLTLYGGDRCVITGRNGCGKSTLLKVLVGELAPSAGRLHRTPSMRIAYLPQQLDYLPGHEKALDWFEAQLQFFDLCGRSQAAMRTFLHRFLFSGGDAFKRIEQLSSGEKMRLQVASFIANKPDLLVLDEPTNHLDLPSIASLERALHDYDGAIIAVSHDRSFRAAINATVGFELKDGRLVSQL